MCAVSISTSLPVVLDVFGQRMFLNKVISNNIAHDKSSYLLTPSQGQYCKQKHWHHKAWSHIQVSRSLTFCRPVSCSVFMCLVMRLPCVGTHVNISCCAEELWSSVETCPEKAIFLFLMVRVVVSFSISSSLFCNIVTSGYIYIIYIDLLYGIMLLFIYMRMVDE